jgi:hypothetical protein
MLLSDTGSSESCIRKDISEGSHRLSNAEAAERAKERDG